MSNKKILQWLLVAYALGMLISHMQMKQIIKEIQKSVVLNLWISNKL